MAQLASNRLIKPSGYRSLVQPTGYRPFNGFLGGDKTSGPRRVTAQQNQLLFGGVPATLSTLTINGQVFTFEWAGAPGVGKIPLVAGGGTAVQATTAALAVLQAQLLDWTTTQTASNVLLIVQKQVGTAYAVSTLLTNIVLTPVASAIGSVLPASLGRVFGFLSAG